MHVTCDLAVIYEVFSPPSTPRRWLRMKLSRQFTVFGSAIFCVVVFSLYLMLDHLQLDHSKNPGNNVGKLQNVSNRISHNLCKLRCYKVFVLHIN